MTAELYAQVMTVAGVAGCFDTKVSDEYALTDPIIVYSEISDTPASDIHANLAGQEYRITLEVQAADITSARAVKAALITALHGWSGGPITSCTFESGGPTLYDFDLIPPRYCMPVDFMITT